MLGFKWLLLILNVGFFLSGIGNIFLMLLHGAAIFYLVLSILAHDEMTKRN